MPHMHRTFLVLLLAARATFACGPQGLQLGDQAPALTVGHALLGEAVAKLAPDRVNVVAVFPTWSIRAREQLPCISGLNAEGAAAVVGVCAREIEGESEPLRLFAETMAEEITFSLHAPDEAHAFERNWLDAAGCDRLPVAFVVDKSGRIVAIQEWGNATDCESLRAAVKEVVGGTWDLERARRDRAAAIDPTRRVAECDAWHEAMKSGEPARIFEASDALLAARIGCEQIVAEVVVTLGARDDAAVQTYEWAKRAVKERAWGHSVALNRLAWFLVDNAEAKHPDLDLALLASQRAVELSGERESAYLDTLALVCFRRGDTARAIEVQRKAVAIAPPVQLPEFEARLKLFEQSAK